MYGCQNIFRIALIHWIIRGSTAVSHPVINLSVTKGRSTTLHVCSVKKGFLKKDRKIIAMVEESRMKIVDENYKNRIHWSNSTASITLTGLQKNDSEMFYFDPKKGGCSIQSYNLTVYEPVSSPTVTRQSVSAESCILLCSVEKAEETTLLWYKDEEKVNQSSSALSLPLTVHKQDFNSSYRCVAANPAENKTVYGNFTTFCHEQNNSENTYIIITIVVPLLLLLFISAGIFLFCCCKKGTTRQTSFRCCCRRDDEISANGNNKGKHLPHPSRTVTVNDNPEAHPMMPPHTHTADTCI